MSLETFKKKMEEFHGFYQLNSAIDGCPSIDAKNLPEGRQYYTYKEGSGTIYIPPSHLWWDCHAREVEIRMADGSCKRAEHIRVGDKLIAYGNKIVTVDNVYTGHEKELICVQTDRGNCIRVSQGHPLLREDGTGIDAAQLQRGDRILSVSGACTTVAFVSRERYENTVYNFSFSGQTEANYIIAGDLYSGDFFAQNLLRDPVKIEEEQKALIAEMEALKKMFGL